MVGSGDEHDRHGTVNGMKSLEFLGVIFFAVLPATSNYRLNSYGFGSGGTASSKTSTYSLEGTVGELSGKSGSTTNATSKPGFIETQQANVPKLASLDNNGGIYYNKLHFVIDSQNNPSDAKYLIAVTTGGVTSYLQPDGTLAASVALGDYQTYATWGGSAGGLILGLDESTAYTVKLKATQGTFSESAYGPSSTQSTAAASITFNLVTSAQPSPPFTVNLGSLDAGTVKSAPDTINTTFSTNGASGGDVYIAGKNGGLLSTSTGYKIASVSNNLTAVAEGFGGQNTSISQSSGGPYTVASPYNGSSNTVGIIDTITRSLYTSTAPVTSGSGALRLKAKADVTDRAATDYQDVLTFIAAANF
jgi:hypothetical protein